MGFPSDKGLGGNSLRPCFAKPSGCFDSVLKALELSKVYCRRVETYFQPRGWARDGAGLYKGANDLGRGEVMKESVLRETSLQKARLIMETETCSEGAVGLLGSKVPIF